MKSTKKTLDYLLSSPSSAECNKNENNSTKNTKKNRNRNPNPNPPPPIPPSPNTSHDETCATDLLLRKFELDASNETYLENIESNPLFNNNNLINKHIKQFNLNNIKYSYQTFITHSLTSKTKNINDLINDGQSLHIVTNFTDIGCPIIKNPKIKKGCWCIEQIKKKTNNIKSIKINPNPLLTQLNVIEYFKNNQNNNNQKNQNNNNNVDLMQKNLILNARTQQYMNSNRMQQIRMQQMLLNARTNNNNIKGINSLTVLGVRKHKDTIVFNNNNNNNNNNKQPPLKRRKKTRWSDK